jgi:hypothetical protein
LKEGTIHMKKIFGMLGGSLVIAILLAVSLAQGVGVSALSARTTGQKVSLPSLPHSPVSPSTLVAQAIHQGQLHFNGGGQAPANATNLTCSPAPCVLPNVQASGNGTQPVNEDPIAANPVNANQLLSGGNDYNCTSSLQGFYASSNGGTTWNHTCMGTLSGQFGEGDPGVGYDLNGVAYITGIDSPNGVTGEIVFEKSTNNGGTWSAPAIAVHPFFSGGLTDKDWLQIDTNASSPHKNALYISVTQFDSSQTHDTITVTHSTNGGSTWTTKQVDTTQTLTSQVDQFSDLAVGKDGTVYVTWLRCPPTGTAGDCGGTTSKMYFSKSTDGGNTWSTPVVLATVKLAPDTCGGYYGCLPHTSERVSNIPAIGVDNSTGSFAGHLYAVTYNYTGTFLQVQVSTSTNGGTTWGAPVHVAPATAKHDQFFPWLTVSSGGKVGVTWLDRRNDPSNISYEAFEAISTNGGTSFSTNKQIATAASNPLNDGFGGAFMGDYTGNYWANATTLYASWMDSRNGSTMQDEVGGFLL